MKVTISDLWDYLADMGMLDNDRMKVVDIMESD